MLETPPTGSTLPPGAPGSPTGPAGPDERAGALPRMTRAQANVIRAFCLWTVWVWATRIGNVWGDDARSAGFKVVHTVIALVSVALAVAAWLVVRRLRRPARVS